LKAPKQLVDRHRLILIARHTVEGEQAEKDRERQAELDAKLHELENK